MSLPYFPLLLVAKLSGDSNQSIRVSIQEQAFSIEQEQQVLSAQSSQIGAVVAFTGLVRDFEPIATTDKNTQSLSNDEREQQALQALLIEHYPAMTQRSIEAICAEACERWHIEACRVVHRVGRLAVQEPIVLVVVASQHREQAFCACEFIMDYLKTSAPFWKKAIFNDAQRWIKAKSRDSAALKKWQ